MDIRATLEQERYAESARELAVRHVAPGAEERDRQGRFPIELVAELGKRGLLGMNVPKTHGGSAAGPVAYALSVMEIARACASTAVLMTTTNLVGEILSVFGTDAQKSEHLEKLASGHYVGASFALSEPDAGSDAGAIRTRATRAEDGSYRLDGQKQWTTSGAFADLLIVWARSGGAGLAGLSCFLVDPHAPGLVIGPPEAKLGLRASNTVSLTLDGVVVPPNAVLGGIGRGFKIAMSALDGGRIGIASQACGIAAASTERMTQYLRAPANAAHSSSCRSALADSRTELDAARLLTLRAAWRKERKLAFSTEAAMAKLYASEAANRICERALTVHGAAGRLAGSGVERYLRDARVTTIYEGTSEIQRLLISRSLLA